MLHIIMCCNQMLAQAHALMITIQYYALGLIIFTHHLITASSLHICISSISLSFVLSREHFVRSEVLTAMTRKIITVIRNPMICSLLQRYHHFGEMCCLYLQGTFLIWWWRQQVINTGTYLPTASHYIPEDSNIQNTLYFNMASRQNN